MTEHPKSSYHTLGSPDKMNCEILEFDYQIDENDFFKSVSQTVHFLHCDLKF